GRHAARKPLEEADAERILHLLQQLAGGRLADVERAGRAAEVALGIQQRREGKLARAQSQQGREVGGSGWTGGCHIPQYMDRCPIAIGTESVAGLLSTERRAPLPPMRRRR